MDLHRLPCDAAMHPDPVDTGWARAVHRGPRTVEQVLGAALAAMNEQDEAERRAADPVAWLRAERRRRSLFWHLFGRH